MGHIFISYSRKDEEYVNKLVEALENEGFDVWIDREMLTGAEWIRVINQKIDTCDAFVIVLTKDSKESKWVNRELLYALQEEKTIFPLLLQGRLWMQLQDLNYFNVKNGSIPDKKFFNDVSKTIPRSERWLKVQQEIADREWAEKARQKAAYEAAERERKEKELREKQARESKRKERKPATVKPKTGRQNYFWFGGIAILVLGIIWFSSINTPTQTTEPTSENNPSQDVSTLIDTEITDSKGITMRLVPEGEFTMGSETDYDEKPIHQVYLDAFYMDIYEVTNAAYKACEDAGACTSPKQTKSYSHDSYYYDSQFDNYPVIYVDWNQAKAYCEWRGGSLPTEAQWEKAARGTDARTYPWGEEIDSNLVNYNQNVGDTTKVGSYEGGISPYGMYDMAGNVWEWTSSLYQSYPYDPNDGREDLNASGSRVLRGGSWLNLVNVVRSAYRSNYVTPGSIFYSVGFRCARSIPVGGSLP